MQHERTYYPDPEAALDAAMGLSSAGHLVALGRDGARPDWYVREIAPAEEA
jgi:hypothetical protein